MLDSIKGELRVYTREVVTGKKARIFFNACVGYTKTEDDEYINYYMQLDFSKAVKQEVAKVYKNEYFDILIKDSWIKCYRNKDGNEVPVLFVNKATIVENEEKDAKSSKKSKAKADEDDENLPF